MRLFFRAPASVQRALLKIDGRPVPISIKLNSRARRMIVKVNPATGEVSVVSPSRRGLSHALDFARGESAWIGRQLAGIPGPVLLAPGATIPFQGIAHTIAIAAGGPAPVWRDEAAATIFVRGRAEHASRRLLDFLKVQARNVFEAKALEYSALLGVKPSRITVRDTASRWGSCSSGRSLSFSWRLILAPPPVLDYVVAHEVGHLREMNHGPRFWAQVRKLVADIETPQDWLKTHGRGLQRYVSDTPSRSAE